MLRKRCALPFVAAVVLTACMSPWELPEDALSEPFAVDVKSGEPRSSGTVAPDAPTSRATSSPTPATTSAVADGGLRAVAIVSHVGDAADASNRAEMERAVAVLQGRGVSVIASYNTDENPMSWSGFVAAARGAHFVLYMGHGVYGWDGGYPGIGADPPSVGGFVLPDGGFASPTDIREDLAGVLAEDAVVIFSHACFTAGSAGGAEEPWYLPEVDAARRIRTYAAPFVDVGVDAYFANNYESVADTVEMILEYQTMSDVYTGFIWHNDADFEVSWYPRDGFELWHNGAPGAPGTSWYRAFVGDPDYRLPGAAPALGGLPRDLLFRYSIEEERLSPAAFTLNPENVGTGSEELTLSVTSMGAWFSVSPEVGTTADAFEVRPGTFDRESEGTYEGSVSFTAAEDVAGSPHEISVVLEVIEGPLYQIYLPIIF